MPYREAFPAAAAIVRLLGPACERIEVAGSIRRLRRACNDIEIVVIPKVIPNLLGEPGDRPLFDLIDAEVRSKRWTARQGHQPWAKSSRYDTPIQLDLFIVTPETWGVILALRTGPVDYSKRIVTEKYRGGLLLDGHQVKDGRLWQTDTYDPIQAGDRILPSRKVVETPEESDFLNFAGGWLDPHLRI